MKKSSFKTLLLFFLLVCVVAELVPSFALAENRKYTIRIYPGNVGTISGSNVQNGIYNDELNYNAYISTPTVTADDEYFVKGIGKAEKKLSQPVTQ